MFILRRTTLIQTISCFHIISHFPPPTNQSIHCATSLSAVYFSGYTIKFKQENGRNISGGRDYNIGRAQWSYSVIQPKTNTRTVRIEDIIDPTLEVRTAANL